MGDVRKSGLLWWLRPDGKTQVTIEYSQHADGSVEPQKIHTVVISTQHGEYEQAHRGRGRQEDFAGDHPEKREAGNLALWGLHSPLHQSQRQVHHWWPAGRCRTYRP